MTSGEAASSKLVQGFFILKTMAKLIVDKNGNISILYKDGIEGIFLWKEMLVYDKSVCRFFYRCERLGFTFEDAYNIYQEAKKFKK